MMNLFSRAHRLLNLDDFAIHEPPVDLGGFSCEMPADQYVLRMMVYRPKDPDLTIPPELMWLDGVTRRCMSIQKANGLDPVHDFIYLTVRNGEVRTVEDDVWHVDGFSMRFPHRPEQNYIWSDEYPTEVLAQGFVFPEDFDPRRHNVHMYFQDNADESKKMTLQAGRLYVLDPYVIHRRQKLAAGMMRKFFRVSFIPIEVEDDTCQPNPLFPMKVYNRDGVVEVRRKLDRYTHGPVA